MSLTLANALERGREANVVNEAIEVKIAAWQRVEEDAKDNIEQLKGRLLDGPSYHVQQICEALEEGKTAVTHGVFLEHFKRWVAPEHFTAKTAGVDLVKGLSPTAQILRQLPGSAVQYVVVVDPATVLYQPIVLLNKVL